MKQSPIDIVPGNALAARFFAPVFKYKTTPLKIGSIVRCVEVPYDPTRYLYVGSQPTDVYQLVPFDFHTPSEHTINGVRCDVGFTWCTPMSLSLRLLPARSSNRPRRRRLR